MRIVLMIQLLKQRLLKEIEIEKNKLLYEINSLKKG